MGQKVNPVGMRIGVNRNWNSRWYANDNDFHVYLNQDIKIRKFLEADKSVKEALLSHIEIERTKTDNGQRIEVFVHVAKPGVIHGQNNDNVKNLAKRLAKHVGVKGIRITPLAVTQPDLDATLVAKDMAKQLEERASFRTVQKKAIQKVRKAGAKGCRTVISGRLGGADIARSEGYKEGIIPLHTLRSDIDYAVAEAMTTYGKLGIKVWICRGEVRKNKPTPENETKGE